MIPSHMLDVDIKLIVWHADVILREYPHDFITHEALYIRSFALFAHELDPKVNRAFCEHLNPLAHRDALQEAIVLVELGLSFTIENVPSP